MTAGRRATVLAGHVVGASAGNQLAAQPTLSLNASSIYHGLLGDLKLDSRNVGMLVAKVIAAHGVKHVFTLVGGHISPLLVGCEQLGIKVADVRHEVTAMFAADAVARLTGVPGVALVTAGPGVTNTITAVQNCALAQSPVVLIGGAAPSLSQGRGALQDIDQMSVIAPIVKKAWRVLAVRDFVPVVREAFQLAASGVPGPVFVEFPLDVLYGPMAVGSSLGLFDMQPKKKIKPEDIPRVIVPSPEKCSKKEWVESRSANENIFTEVKNKPPFPMETAFRFLIKTVYADAPWDAIDKDTLDFGPLPLNVPAPTAASVSQIAGMLKKAKRPLLLIGSQAMLTSEINGPRGRRKAGPDELADAVRALGVPSFLGGMARGLFGENHPMHIRQNRREAMAKCDLLIMAGVVPDFRLDYGRSLPKKAPIVTINRSERDLTLNADFAGMWKPTMTLQADSCHFLVELAAAMKGATPAPEWAAELKAAEVAKEAGNEAKGNEPASGQSGQQLVNPIAACYAIDKVMPKKDVIIVADGGDFVATAAYTLRPREPLGWLDPGAFGTLGVGGGFALGAKLARPDKEVWLLWGDGSCGYSVAEFDSFTRHNAPVIAVVGNDACWSQIERDQVPMFGSSVACPLAYTSYDKVAEGFGGKGFCVGADGQYDAHQVEEVLRQAQSCAKQGAAVLVNVHIGKTDFREGSISV
mmetsp:Transcript_683/g.1504  ORF Transcript_683/g.1504 Transcript_683/m.1504 type:complete len:697 (+) Transcript_683:22-2112(+)